MLTRITISLTREEKDALLRLARSEMRPLRQHARWLLVSEAREQGLLPKTEEAQGEVNHQEARNEHAAR